MDLNDSRWEILNGGRGGMYDASPALRALAAGDWAAYGLLWDNLHHQGDIGEASYAAVPALVAIECERFERDWNFYGLVNTIEACRHREKNPPLPGWLSEEYRSALRKTMDLALTDLAVRKVATPDDEETMKQALAKGCLTLGSFLCEFSLTEVHDLFE